MGEPSEAQVDEGARHGRDGEVPTGRVRQRVIRFVLAVIALQLLIPLTYYMRDDPYDERFAWRMFSAVRLHSCRTSATETTSEATDQPIALASVIHRAWVNHLSRNRGAVVHAFLRHRCAVPDVKDVEVRNLCVTPDGTTLEPQVYTRDCETGETTEPDALIVEAER